MCVCVCVCLYICTCVVFANGPGDEGQVKLKTQKMVLDASVLSGMDQG